jgi:Flp pilus assembly protein TadG
MGQGKGHIRSRGQGLVEFALALPVFLLLTLGVIELGWLVYTNHTLANATREGARYAMVHGEMSGDVATIDSVHQVIEQRAGGLNGTVETTGVEFVPNAEPGSDVTVSTSYEYQPIVGFILGTNPLTLTNQSTVIVQY